MMYWKPAVGVGLITFFGTWAYAIAAYGFWLGICLGWLPAMIVAAVAGTLWPVTAMGAFIIVGIAVIQAIQHAMPAT